MIEEVNLVSIIVPTFNNWLFLEQMIISVQNQSYENWECIIVDDLGGDGTDHLIKKYTEKDKRIKYFKRPNTYLKGANSCRNYGFEKSLGDLVNWFDSDDVMLENFILDKVKKFEKTTDIVICSATYTDEALNPKHKMKMDDAFELYKSYLLWEQHFITNSVMFRKTFLEGKELFNPMIKKGQEAELFSRLFYKIKNQQYKIINISLFLYRTHSSSSTSKNSGYRKDFKESESYTVMANLFRSSKINEIEVAQSMYRLLINMLEKAIRYDHQYNVDFIMNGLNDYLRKRNKFVLILLNLIVMIAQKINISFLKWNVVLRKLPIK